MSDNFGRFEEAIFNAGKEVSKATKELASTAKSKIDLKSKEYDLKNLYAELGKAYYQKHSDDDIYEYSVMQDIIDLEKEIQRMKE